MRGSYRLTPNFRVSGGPLSLVVFGTIWAVYTIFAACLMVCYYLIALTVLAVRALVVPAWRRYPVAATLTVAAVCAVLLIVGAAS